MLLDEAQMRCLRALLDTLIPPDDYPGAWDAGVGDYLLRQLEGDLADLLPRYRSWLNALDNEALAACAAGFAELSPDSRTELLQKIESNDLATEWSQDAAEFFRQIVEHSSEGFYSDPGNGGNRDGIAWRMVGFEVRG